MTALLDLCASILALILGAMHWMLFDDYRQEGEYEQCPSGWGAVPIQPASDCSAALSHASALTQAKEE